MLGDDMTTSQPAAICCRASPSTGVVADTEGKNPETIVAKIGSRSWASLLYRFLRVDPAWSRWVLALWPSRPYSGGTECERHMQSNRACKTHRENPIRRPW